MKTKKMILAALAALLPLGAWADTSCQCPGDTNYAGQDACGNDVCDAADVDTYPYTDRCGNGVCEAALDGQYDPNTAYDCYGDGSLFACESADCPVVTSITLNSSQKSEGDTLSVSDFTIETSPEGSTVTLSGDLTVNPGTLSVTAKASDYDSGKTISIPVVKLTNVELAGFSFSSDRDSFSVTGNYEGPSSATLELSGDQTICTSSCSHSLQTGSFSHGAEISNVQHASAFHFVAVLVGLASTAIWVGGEELYEWQFGNIPATATSQASSITLTTSNSNYQPSFASTLVDFEYGGYGRKRWNGFAYVKKNSFYGASVPASNQVSHVPTDEYVKVWTGAGLTDSSGNWDHSTPKAGATSHIRTLSAHTDGASTYEVYGSLYVYQIPDWNDPWGSETYEQKDSVVDFYNPS